MLKLVPDKRIVRDVMLFIADQYDVTPDELLGRERSRERTHARRVSIMAIRRLFPVASNTTIGRIYDRDYSWVCNNIQALGDELYTDKNVRDKVTDIVDRAVKHIQEKYDDRDSSNQRASTDRDSHDPAQQAGGS